MLTADSVLRSVKRYLYRIRHPLPRGGQGEPYLAEREAEEMFVLKVLFPEFNTKSSRRRADYLVKHDLASRSPILCADIDYVSTEKVLAPIAPYARGSLLSTVLETKPLSFSASIQVGCALAKGLSVLEECEIAHGDLHSGNVIVEVDAGVVRGVKLIDLNNFVAPGVPEPPCFGQPLYMAPEIRLDGHLPDVLSDRYAFAGLMHELILRRHICAGFESADEYDAAAGRWSHDPARIRGAGSEIGGYPPEILNADLARLFRRGISSERDNRPTADTWAQALQAALFSISACPRCGTPTIVDSSKRVCPGCRAPYPTLALRSRYGVLPLRGAATVVGRSDFGRASTVSDRHAVFWRRGPDYALEDLSTNGTYRRSEMGWARLGRREPLPLVQAGDVLQFADQEATLEEIDEH